MLCIMDTMKKPYQPRGKVIRTNITIDPDVKNKARTIGKGNVSAGIAIAVREFPEGNGTMKDTQINGDTVLFIKHWDVKP